jgi:hypothetical protein
VLIWICIVSRCNNIVSLNITIAQFIVNLEFWENKDYIIIICSSFCISGSWGLQIWICDIIYSSLDLPHRIKSTLNLELIFWTTRFFVFISSFSLCLNSKFISRDFSNLIVSCFYRYCTISVEIIGNIIRIDFFFRIIAFT